jgi:hypothetical protein
MAGLLAEGTLYLNRKINGVAQGWKKVEGTTRFSISNSSEIKEQKSKDLAKYGQVTASVALPNPSELALTISDFTAESLAIGLMGDDSVYTVAGATISNEVVIADIGAFVPLSKSNVTPGSVVVTDSTGATTYVEGTHYEINYGFGMLRAISTITDAQSLQVDYTHGAISGFNVNGGTRPQVNGALRLDGRNLADGKKLMIEVLDALLVSDGEIDFMADDFVEFGMTGRMNTPSGQPSAFTVKYY